MAASAQIQMRSPQRQSENKSQLLAQDIPHFGGYSRSVNGEMDFIDFSRAQGGCGPKLTLNCWYLDTQSNVLQIGEGYSLL